jgi:hypothetical protein
MGGRPVVIDLNAPTQQSYELDEFLRKGMPVETGPSLDSPWAFDSHVDVIPSNLDEYPVTKSIREGISDASWDAPLPDLAKAAKADQPAAPAVEKPGSLENWFTICAGLPSAT